MSGSVPSTTFLTYTPTWKFDHPWVVVSGPTAPFIFQLNATITPSDLPKPVPTAVTFDGPNGGTLLINTSPSPSATSRSSPTSTANVSGGTTTSPTFANPITSFGAMPPNDTLATRTSDNESPSLPTITATPPSPSVVQTPLLSSKDKSRLSLGQTVGMAIGCIFVGAALAALVACVLVRRKGRSDISSSERSGSKSSMSDKLIDRKLPPIIMEHIEQPPPYMRFETLLAKPSSDDDLVAMFTQLNTSISDYVQRYPSPDPRLQLLAKETTSTRILGELLGSESPIGVNRMFTSLRNDQTQAASLRHIIACSILQNIRSSGAPETTLLPPEISECMSSMTGMRGDVNGMAAC